MKFGYARVSSNTQDHAAQVEALKAAGCERIFSEKASGKSTNGRPEFARLMKALRHGDVVTVVTVTIDVLHSARQHGQPLLHVGQHLRLVLPQPEAHPGAHYGAQRDLA